MTDCIEWEGTLTSEGYGVLKENYVQIKAHRRAYENAHGPIPDGLVIDHLCSNKRCVNPEHLRAVTSGENSSRYWNEERTPPDCCPKCGSELVVWGRKRPRRKCPPCSAARLRAYRERSAA